MSLLTILLVLVAGCAEKPDSVPSKSDETAQGVADGSTATVSPDMAEQKAVDQQREGEADMPPDNSGVAGSANGESREEEAVQDPVDTETQAKVATLLEQMGSSAAVERRAASNQLDQLGQPAIPYIVESLREGAEPQKLGAATYLIGRVSPRDERAAAALIESLDDKNRDLRHAALQAVEKMAEPQLAAALPALIRLATDRGEEEAYRSRAIRAITKLGPQGAEATEALKQLALQDPSMDVRRASYYAISRIAPAEAAEQFFQTRLQSAPEADLRRLAAKWLPRVARSERSLECLVAALGDSDQSVRLEAVDATVELGKPALPQLVEASKSDDVQTRRHAVLAIGKLGLLAVDAKDALRARLDDPDQQVRELARAALSVLD